MLTNNKNKKNKVLAPAAIALSLYCGNALINNKAKNVHADTINTVSVKHNKKQQNNSLASNAQTSQASSAAPASDALSSSAQTSQASSVTPARDAQSSSAQTSQASSATPVSDAQSSSAQTSQASSATPASDAQSSSAQTSQAISAAPASDAQSSSAQASQASSATPTSDAQNNKANNVKQTGNTLSDYNAVITPDGQAGNDVKNATTNSVKSLFNYSTLSPSAITLYSNGNGDTVPSRSIGVDVSNYQSSDLSGFARRGAKYAIVKITEGTGYVNPIAGAQISSAARNGMQVQLYHFAHIGGNSNEAIAEANFAISKARQFGVPAGSYLACDYETDATGNVNANTNAVITFMNQVAAAGYKPILYSGAYYMKAHLNLNAITSRFGNCLWVASYPTTAAVNGPDFDYFPSMDHVIMWQFSDNLWGMSVDGDVNVLPMTDSGGSTVHNTSNGNTSSSSSNTSNEPTWVDSLGVTWHKETGIFTVGNTPLHLRWGATTSSSVIALLQPGQKVEYDAWAYSGGYTWIRQPRGNGEYGYVAVRDASGPFGTFSDVPGNNNNSHNNSKPAPKPAPAVNNYTGQKQVNGKWQYWNNGKPIKNSYQWIADQHKEVYYDGNGNMVYGEQNINGHWQYFDPTSGAQAKNTFVNLPDGRSVYYDGNGNMVYGQQRVWGANRYFDPVNGNEAKNKFVNVNGKTYYYGSDGSMVYGKQTINGKTYNFNPKTGVMENSTDGTVTIAPGSVDYGNGQGPHADSNSSISTLQPSKNTTSSSLVANTVPANNGSSNTVSSNNNQSGYGNGETDNTQPANTGTSNNINPSVTVNNSNGTQGTISAGNTQINKNSNHADVSANYNNLTPGLTYTLHISMDNPDGTPAGSQNITFTPTTANGSVNVNVPLNNSDIKSGISALKPSISVDKISNANTENKGNGNNAVANDIADNQAQASHITGNGMGLGVTKANNATSGNAENTAANNAAIAGNTQISNTQSANTNSANNSNDAAVIDATDNAPSMASTTVTTSNELASTNDKNDVTVGAMIGLSLTAMLSTLGLAKMRKQNW